jgi:hypothetical protein
MRVQRGSRQLKSLKDRLAEFVAGVRKATDELPPYARGDEALGNAVYRTLRPISI